jgi:hypothetical protein
MSKFWVDTEFRGDEDSTEFDDLESAWEYAFSCLDNNPGKVTAIRGGGNVIADRQQIITANYERKQNARRTTGESTT